MRFRREPVSRNRIVIYILFVARVCRTRSFGINPRDGGIPPIDIIIKAIGVVVDGLEFFQDIRSLQESIYVIVINRISVVVIRM